MNNEHVLRNECGLPRCTNSAAESIVVAVEVTEGDQHALWTRQEPAALLRVCEDHYDRLGLLEDEAALAMAGGGGHMAALA